MSVKLLKKPFLDPSKTTVLVTGASGFIGSHVVNEALLLGYSVRGTARSQAKADATSKTFNSSKYSTAIVSDFTHDTDGIANAVKGVDAIIHVASDTTFSEDVDAVVGGVVKGVEHFLEAAAKEPKVKRFVLTSSSTAALLPIPNKEVTVTKDSWNDVAVDAAYNKKGESVGPNPYPFIVYAASKTEGEKAVWKFMKEKKPHFQANAVLPNANTGRILDSVGATGGMAIGVWKDGKRPQMVPQWYIDVIDDARLHIIAAVLAEKVVDERIFAFAGPFNMNDLAETVQKVRSDSKAKSCEIDESEGRDLSKIPNERGAKLLEEWYGQKGYKGFEESIKENLEKC